VNVRRVGVAAALAGFLGLSTTDLRADGPRDDAFTLEPATALRLRYEGADAAFLGPPTDEYRDVLMTRILASMKASDRDGRALFLQLGWHEEHGRVPRPLPTDDDGLDVQQAYIDVPVTAASHLRVGRQEVVLGSARLVSVRDSPNIRRSFDGAVWELRRGTWNTRVMALAPVAISRGAFDDGSDRSTRFGGVYATKTFDRESGLDLYALGYRRDGARFQAGTGLERRASWGTRLFGRRGAVDHNVEAILQTGRFGRGSIRAWTVASDLGWKVSSGPAAPRLGLKANVTSGDRDRADRRLQTFNPLFPNLAYFSEASTLAPENHADLQPSVGWKPTATTSLRVSGDAFWRTSVGDAVYRANGMPFAVSSRSRFVASQFEIDASWAPRGPFELRASFVDWRPSRSLEAAGARTTRFVMMSVSARWP
jgi:hypothetical protein